ncbi:MAG: hypothetical protein V2I76_10005 [Roseobacter sp.]|jgi:hypothetical protein|nr:hypothetical protein [Roseobacter sp.]
MFIRSTLFGLALATTATAAFAGGSGQHSAEATYHSGEAASHAGAAVASGAATVAAVPIIAVGSAIAITGEVLEEVGTHAIDTGAGLSAVGRPNQTINITVMPNAAPTLD